MSRITHATYCERRQRLQQAWQQHPGRFAELPAIQQWELHDYYRFTEDLSPEHLHWFWSDIRVDQPSLPQQAGRAYAAIEPLLTRQPAPAPVVANRHQRRHGSKDRQFRVKGLVQPRPDMKRLTKVLLEIARQ